MLQYIYIIHICQYISLDGILNLDYLTSLKVRTDTLTKPTHTHIFIYIYIHMYL